ncbi:MAG: dihydropteroate synthase [Planctomycetota bacterium]|nr:MAG: dihydropteroate synthase [Planctomycetota bacterium]
MALPWQLPGYEREHHAVPLGGGWWRGPAARTSTCERRLRELGVLLGPELQDGACGYRLLPEFEGPGARDAAGDPDQPETRAHWIAARLAAALAAAGTPPPPPQFMAVLNLTPDSFSDGGELLAPGAVEAAAAARVAEGARWLDLGAESTRPGATAVAVEVQLQRLLPALRAVRGCGALVSVDTRSAAVAAACLDSGAAMINDVSGLEDPDMGPLLARHGCPVVLLHMRGTPADMAQRAGYRHLLGAVADELAARVHRALAAGIRPAQIYLDPGIGFAKTAQHSLELIGRLGALRALGFPLLVGPSRKSFLGAVLGGRPPRERDGGSAGAAAVCAAQGAAILRLHRGGAVWDAVLVAAAAAAAARAEVVPRTEVAA